MNIVNLIIFLAFKPQLLEEPEEVEAVLGKPFTIECRFFASPIATVTWKNPSLLGKSYNQHVDQFGVGRLIIESKLTLGIKASTYHVCFRSGRRKIGGNEQSRQGLAAARKKKSDNLERREKTQNNKKMCCQCPAKKVFLLLNSQTCHCFRLLKTSCFF